MPESDHESLEENASRADRTALTDSEIEAALAVLRSEFRSNPDFARRLLAALSASVNDAATPQALDKTSASKPSARAQTGKEDGAFHAVVVLRDEGAAMLRGRLERLGSKAALKAVAKRSGLRLTGAAAKRTPTRADLVDGIVRAAEHYDAQRTAAAK